MSTHPIVVVSSQASRTQSGNEWVVRPGDQLVGLHFAKVVVREDVERTPNFEAWLQAEVYSRIVL